MYRTFITSISLQHQLDKHIYEPRNFELVGNVETAFPIIPIIKEFMERPDNVRIITIRTENSDTTENYNKLVEELADLGINEDQVKKVVLTEDQMEVEAKALMSIVDAIDEDSIAYADITYGTKPMSAAILYSMSVVEYLKDVETGGIYYGEIQRKEGKAVSSYLYETTCCKRIMDFLVSIDKLGIDKRREALKTIFNL